MVNSTPTESSYGWHKKKANNSRKLTQFPGVCLNLKSTSTLIGKIYAETLGKSRTGKTSIGMGWVLVFCVTMKSGNYW